MVHAHMQCLVQFSTLLAAGAAILLTSFSVATGLVLPIVSMQLAGQVGMPAGRFACAMPAGSEMMLICWPCGGGVKGRGDRERWQQGVDDVAREWV